LLGWLAGFPAPGFGTLGKLDAEHLAQLHLDSSISVWQIPGRSKDESAPKKIFAYTPVGYIRTSNSFGINKTIQKTGPKSPSNGPFWAEKGGFLTPF
jgi:hypothetical protein